MYTWNLVWIFFWISFKTGERLIEKQIHYNYDFTHEYIAD